MSGGEQTVGEGCCVKQGRTAQGKVLGTCIKAGGEHQVAGGGKYLVACLCLEECGAVRFLGCVNHALLYGIVEVVRIALVGIATRHTHTGKEDVLQLQSTCLSKFLCVTLLCIHNQADGITHCHGVEASQMTAATYLVL